MINWKRVAVIAIIFYIIYTGGSCDTTTDAQQGVSRPASTPGDTTPKS